MFRAAFVPEGTREAGRQERNPSPLCPVASVGGKFASFSCFHLGSRYLLLPLFSLCGILTDPQDELNYYVFLWTATAP